MKKKLLPLAMLASAKVTPCEILCTAHMGPPRRSWPTNPVPKIGFDRSREGYVEVIEEGEGVGTEVVEFNLYLSPAGSTKAEWI
jgi:hypothetical protein